MKEGYRNLKKEYSDLMEDKEETLKQLRELQRLASEAFNDKPPRMQDFHRMDAMVRLLREHWQEVERMIADLEKKGIK